MSPERDLKSSSQISSSPGSADLNCDMGEGMLTDEAIMPWISSANIACGYHTGDEKTIWKTIELAVQHKVAIGAHVSYFDRQNFGRKEMDISISEIYELVTQQLIVMHEITGYLETKIHHVKPHGALYNTAAKEAAVAAVIARAVKDFDETLVLYGLGGSCLVSEAKKIGLRTAGEAFADRAYQDNGSLVPRSLPNSLIVDADKAVAQVLQIVREKIITSISGKKIPVQAETICIHGDGEHAVEFAKAIHECLKQNNIIIKAG